MKHDKITECEGSTDGQHFHINDARLKIGYMSAYICGLTNANTRFSYDLL